ncbi:MAG: HAMP domain-containing histidine kinase, partial [Rhodospirillales bacterium]|nr:HAMP domain-containing histidine kinase [Rhodospirillales bacterium]
SGEGIAEDSLKQVFKPFVTSKRTGLGIGLALVKRIVERHGGSVALSSEKGRGTTVSFRFPLEAG